MVQITKEEMEKYELDLLNHQQWVNGRREFLKDILDSVTLHGIERTREIFEIELSNKFHMDAPNKPNYYRANND